MAKNKASTKKEVPHAGVAAFISSDQKQIALVTLPPHLKHECEHKAEEAEQLVCGHETVYEDKSAHTGHVGYSKRYAANYDAAFKN